LFFHLMFFLGSWLFLQVVYMSISSLGKK
jgi:hypothetical protein